MNKKGFFGWIFVLTILIIIIASAYPLLYAITSGQETVTIKEKWVKYHDKDAKYLVSSTDGQVFQITDTLFRWRFDSSNLYAYLEAGQNCQFKTQGWRFPLFSDYKNIIEATCQ